MRGDLGGRYEPAWWSARAKLWLALFVALFSPIPPREIRAQEPAGAGEYSYARHYLPGEIDHYELRTRTEGSPGELIAVSKHETRISGGIPYERIRWTRLTESIIGDQSGLALETPFYQLSLHPQGELQPPQFHASTTMLGVVSDLYTFFFAISRRAGVDQVRRAGEEYQSPQSASVAFPDEADFVIGQDRIEAHLKLVSIGDTEVTYQSDLLPPRAPSLPMHRPWMEPPVCGNTPNNFQMVRRLGEGLLVAWGCEQYRITTRVERASGKIFSAHMENLLRWNTKYCQDETLQDCEDRPGVTKRRLVDLMLKPRFQDRLPEALSVNPTDGLPYAWVPPGSFQMGCVPTDEQCYEEEKPLHRVTIGSGFWMGRTEVTVEAYQRFAAATGRAMPAEPGSGTLPDYPGWENKEHPIVKVNWEEARDFCDWAGGRLPTEAEWEYAARGGAAGLKYPWGNDRAHDEANFWRTGGEDRWRYTAPVGCFPPNGYGLYDMAGNVYEWVQDWFDEDYYARSPSSDPQGPAAGRQRVVRGGAGFINPRVLRTSARLRSFPDSRNANIGFRCLREYFRERD